jgi:hypothetical protein
VSACWEMWLCGVGHLESEHDRGTCARAACGAVVAEVFATVPDAGGKTRSTHVRLPVDVARIAAENSGELADVVRATRQEPRADVIDLFAEYLQETADNEQVDWDAVLTDLAAREMKWRGLEPGT